MKAGKTKTANVTKSAIVPPQWSPAMKAGKTAVRMCHAVTI